jgi:hypothetical protein
MHPTAAKWIVRIVGTLPPSKKAHGVLEVLAAGTQGVIVGTHDSGASIEYDGAQIVTLTADDIRRLWHTLTGDELGHTHRHEEAGPPDAAAVQRGMTLAETCWPLATSPTPLGRNTRTGAKPCWTCARSLNHYRADPHAARGRRSSSWDMTDASARPAITHAVKTRIHQHGGSGWALLKEIAGYQPRTRPMTWRMCESS